MPARRIIPCLDVRNGRVVKGVRFRDHRDMGDIVAHAMRYRDEGADELVFYDISASPEGRTLDTGWVTRVSDVIDIPFAVAGGIRTRDQAAACLGAGADKVSVNSPALERPELIGELARDFGSQCVVLGVDTLAGASGYIVQRNSGDPEKIRATPRRTLDWIREAVERGAGEIVLNCMTRDGVREGFDIDHCREAAAAVSIPLVASGGAGAREHFRDVFRETEASGALAATVFHARTIAIPRLKEYLATCGIEMRR
ncbi:MAG: imidazole glycerol phosphate synthase subunit HisF [Parasphingopyxis sp.]|nr:imidazole glycerol phosphate synthase subunit HisF [Sphingomonadales bacterium]